MVLSAPVFSLPLVMFRVTSSQTSNGVFRFPTWVEDNVPSFEYFRKIALRKCLQITRKGRDSSPSSLLMRYNILTP